MPTTWNNLFDRIISVENLLRAAHKAALGKREKLYIDAFRLNLEREVWQLRDELCALTYQPGAYRSFWIHEPKKRLISAAPFRDRVVHHALCNVIEPLWERRFVSESFANRQGKGTGAARDHFARGIARYHYVLRCDIRKFFPSIDHGVLKRRFRRVVACAKTLWLMDAIVDASNAQEPVDLWFAGDDLFTPSERRRGLPLGNQTSQFFSNVYLDPVDHFAKETLRCDHYARFVDDLALFADDKDTLAVWLQELRAFGATLRLELHGRKSRVYRCGEGVTFLGVRFWPGRRRLAATNVRHMARRLRANVRAWTAGTKTFEALRRSWHGWRGHAVQAHAEGLIRSFRRKAAAWRACGERASMVVRGGSWNNNANNCRAANRNNNTPDNRNNNLGVRVVVEAPSFLKGQDGVSTDAPRVLL